MQKKRTIKKIEQINKCAHIFIYSLEIQNNKRIKRFEDLFTFKDGDNDLRKLKLNIYIC